METVKLSTIIKLVEPELAELLTSSELAMPVVLRDGIESVSNNDILEIIEASILLKGKSTPLQ